MVSILVGFFSFILLLLFQSHGIQAGDSGDLVTAAATFGVAHPPGYPLYTFLGWILSHIPVFTVSWRVGLLSSLPHAITVAIMYRLVFLLTKRIDAAFFSVLLLVGNYLFFLYGTTPEVFGLLNIFVIGIVYLWHQWQETKKSYYIYWLSFIAGLALTHHHMILFLFPAVAFGFWRERQSIKLSYASITKTVGLFLLGLLPYLYVLLAAHGSSVINWDRVVNFTNFMRLITRADYGTFQSGSIIGALPVQRLIQIKVLAEYIVIDYTLIGIVLMLIGVYSLWIKKRAFAIFSLVAIASVGPVFFSYASFPLSVRFTLATLERFLLPLYVFLCVIAGVGFAYLMDSIKRNTHMKSLGSIAKSFSVIGLLFPLIIVGTTLWKFWGYPTDRTAEHLAYDIFTQIPTGSILVMDRDTPLFTTQYMRYAKGVRVDIILLHGSRLSVPDYQETISRIYPSLAFPQAESDEFIKQFLIANAEKKAVFSYMKYPVGADWFWVPHGIVYQLLPKDKLPAVDQMKMENIRIWTVMHDPGQGILSRYRHLMLSDVQDVYTTARLEFGKTILRAGDIETARSQFEAAIRYGGDAELSDAYMYAGLSELFSHRCSEAIAHFEKAREFSLSVNNEITLYESQTYKDCFGDTKKAEELYTQYLKSQEEKQTPLEKL